MKELKQNLIEIIAHFRTAVNRFPALDSYEFENINFELRNLSDKIISELKKYADKPNEFLIYKKDIKFILERNSDYLSDQLKWEIHKLSELNDIETIQEREKEIQEWSEAMNTYSDLQADIDKLFNDLFVIANMQIKKRQTPPPKKEKILPDAENLFPDGLLLRILNIFPDYWERKGNSHDGYKYYWKGNTKIELAAFVEVCKNRIKPDYQFLKTKNQDLARIFFNFFNMDYPTKGAKEFKPNEIKQNLHLPDFKIINNIS